MTIKQAIEQLNFMIQQHICYEEVVLEDDNEDAQEELYETEVELEALRMAVRALEEKPRWIPCAERLPEMHEEELDDGIYYTSDAVLFSAADRVHVGFCVRYNNELFWEMQDGHTCANVTAWMPMPEAYGGE